MPKGTLLVPSCMPFAREGSEVEELGVTDADTNCEPVDALDVLQPSLLIGGECSETCRSCNEAVLTSAPIVVWRSEVMSCL